MKQVSLLVIGLLTLSLNAYSATGVRTAKMSGGSADTGGGNAVGDQLLDLFENEGASAINVTQQRAYQEVLVPIFKNLDTKVKFLSTFLMSASANKTWFLDKKVLTDPNCINQSMISVEKTIVGCQGTLEVRLYQPWYEDAQVDIKNKAALIMHEFVRGHALKIGNMSDDTVKSLTRLFLNADKVSEQQLASALVESKLVNGPDAFTTGSQFAETERLLNLVYSWNCTNGEKNISWYNDILDGQSASTPAAYKYQRAIHAKFRAGKMTCASLKAEMNN